MGVLGVDFGWYGQVEEVHIRTDRTVVCLGTHHNVLKDADKLLEIGLSDDSRRFVREVGLHIGNGCGLLVVDHVGLNNGRSRVYLFSLSSVKRPAMNARKSTANKELRKIMICSI